MKSMFLPKYEPNIARISALYCGTVQVRNPYNIWFIFWEKRCLHKFILKFTDLQQSNPSQDLLAKTAGILTVKCSLGQGLATNKNTVPPSRDQQNNQWVHCYCDNHLLLWLLLPCRCQRWRTLAISIAQYRVEFLFSTNHPLVPKRTKKNPYGGPKGKI